MFEIIIAIITIGISILSLEVIYVCGGEGYGEVFDDVFSCNFTILVIWNIMWFNCRLQV